MTSLSSDKFDEDKSGDASEEHRCCFWLVHTDESPTCVYCENTWTDRDAESRHAEVAIQSSHTTFQQSGCQRSRASKSSIDLVTNIVADSLEEAVSSTQMNVLVSCTYECFGMRNLSFYLTPIVFLFYTNNKCCITLFT